MSDNKILIVGAGFAGATIARLLAEKNIKVEIIDKRLHIAGNSFDFLNKNNERVHKYGPHIMHGNKDSNEVKFLSRFTEWTNYEHKVKALLENGKTTDLPINRKTLEDVFKIEFRNSIHVKEFVNFIRNSKLVPKNTDEYFEYKFGNELADIFFRPYTRKMWGCDPKLLSVGIGARIPIRTNYDDRYFSDNFQVLPRNGHTKLIENILDHQNISIKLGTSFEKKMEKFYEHSFLCMPIDNYFDHKKGKLPYRSILFEDRKSELEDLPSTVVNFTDNSKYTRMTQWNLFPNSPKNYSKTKTITYEIPCKMEANSEEYYYPVHTSESLKIYKEYKNLASKIENITFCGRTGLFRYLDMLPCVSLHLKIASKFINKRKL